MINVIMPEKKMFEKEYHSKIFAEDATIVGTSNAGN
jgi:hypothetical protein